MDTLNDTEWKGGRDKGDQEQHAKTHRWEGVYGTGQHGHQPTSLSGLLSSSLDYPGTLQPCLQDDTYRPQTRTRKHATCKHTRQCAHAHKNKHTEAIVKTSS